MADHPGRWQLHSFVPGQGDRGPAVDVVYEGHEQDSPQGFPPGARLRPISYADMGGPPHSGAADRTYQLTLSGGMMGSTSWTINGKSYPRTDPIRVRQGDRVRIRLVNMSMEDHPMHLHGHAFQVVSVGGQPVDGPVKDTLTLHHMEAYEIEFVANNPGTWLFHCHNLVHMEGGLVAEVRYE